MNPSTAGSCFLAVEGERANTKERRWSNPSKRKMQVAAYVEHTVRVGSKLEEDVNGGYSYDATHAGPSR